MLVKVLKSRLVLGTTRYNKGDVFDCRDAEARLLIHARYIAKTDEKVTKASPAPGKTGLSIVRGVATPTAPRPAAVPAPKASVAPAPAPIAPEPVAPVAAPRFTSAQQEPAETAGAAARRRRKASADDEKAAE